MIAEWLCKQKNTHFRITILRPFFVGVVELRSVSTLTSNDSCEEKKAEFKSLVKVVGNKSNNNNILQSKQQVMVKDLKEMLKR